MVLKDLKGYVELFHGLEAAVFEPGDLCQGHAPWRPEAKSER